MYLSSILTQTSQKGFAQARRWFARFRLVQCEVALLLAVAATGPAVAQGSGAAPEVLALGRHLAGECAACHTVAGLDGGAVRAIPTLVGRSADDLIALLKSYAAGEPVAGRPMNAAMVSVAQSLSEGERAAVASYLASQPAAR
jgi:cytochrome c553